jgi:tetratricopeptide (TPR) repeat protein
MTWNKDLAYEIGTSMGQEYQDANNYGWYGPAMNTHRSAFAGRNFEYYSEDGVLAGLIAAAELNGANSVEGFDKIQAEYKGTEAANSAAFLAAAAALQAGDIEKAEAELAAYTPAEGAAGEMLNAKVLGLKGDIAVEKNDMQTAAERFAEAATASNDEHTFVTYTKKLALVYEAMGDEAKAQECYKSIVAKYPAQEMQMAKFIR